jgi:hypothetical protein
MHHDSACAETHDVALKAEGNNSVCAGSELGARSSRPHKPRVDLEGGSLVTDLRLPSDPVSCYRDPLSAHCHSFLAFPTGWYRVYAPCKAKHACEVSCERTPQLREDQAVQVTLTEAAQIAAQCSAVNAMFMHARSHGPYGTLQVCTGRLMLPSLVRFACQVWALPSPPTFQCTSAGLGWKSRWSVGSSATCLLS